MRTAIICNGSIADYELCKQRLQQVQQVICADGGTRHAFHMGITPDVIIGDLDSSDRKFIEHFEALNVPFIKYNSDKDKTDTQICLEYAMEQSDEIWLLGATGSRLDHTLANINLLKLAADKGKKACVMNENNEIYLTKDSISLAGNKGDLLSLLPFSDQVTGINLKGTYYPLDNAVIELGSSYGVSNVFLENTIHLTIDTGYILVIKSKD